ncbi:MAG: sigma-70 family RNA polymerase sigma factor [Acidobacteriota bacterium]
MEDSRTPSSREQLTQMLVDWGKGDENAMAELMPLVYEELHRLARRYMSRERAGHTLQATALVNEAYLRLIDQTRVNWQNRAQFYAIAAQQMRRILIDHARSHHYAKRGGGAPRISLDETPNLSVEKSRDLVALDDALRGLAEIDQRKSQVVELRFFGGLSTDEIAALLNVSPVTVLRDWSMAKAWLHREMKKGGEGGVAEGDRDRDASGGDEGGGAPK